VNVYFYSGLAFSHLKHTASQAAMSLAEIFLDIAIRNQPKLLRLMHMTEDEYAKLPVADKKAKIADVLDIDKRYVATSVPASVPYLHTCGSPTRTSIL